MRTLQRVKPRLTEYAIKIWLGTTSLIEQLSDIRLDNRFVERKLIRTPIRHSPVPGKVENCRTRHETELAGCFLVLYQKKENALLNFASHFITLSSRDPNVDAAGRSLAILCFCTLGYAV